LGSVEQAVSGRPSAEARRDRTRAYELRRHRQRDAAVGEPARGFLGDVEPTDAALRVFERRLHGMPAVEDRRAGEAGDGPLAKPRLAGGAAAAGRRRSPAPSGRLSRSPFAVAHGVTVNAKWVQEPERVPPVSQGSRTALESLTGKPI